MMSCGEAEDLFFDSVNHLPAEGSDGGEVLGCEFWKNELRSVKERRDAFLQEMGLVDDLCSTVSSIEMHKERVVERSGEVSSSCSASSLDCAEEDEVFCGRQCNGDGNLVAEEREHETHDEMRQNLDVCEDGNEPSSSKSHKRVDSANKKFGHWWRGVINKHRGMVGGGKCELDQGESKRGRIKVKVNKKKSKELSALFATQEIRAHKGIIWTMKFSPDGQYLASAGQDGVVRIWKVKCVQSCLERFTDLSSPTRGGNTGFGKEKKEKVPILVPDEIFQIGESPMHEFHGHNGDVLDLAWSKSNCLISSSIDRTVRMWKVGSDDCLGIFHHTDYVTCVQFSPVDDQSFISGSVDGKIRIWGVLKGRVLDWADVGDAVTAVCYQPDGQGFVVGSVGGTCHFYEAKGGLAELTAHILILSSKKSSSNKITGIQFSPEDSQNVMVMCEDSKLRILDRMEVVCKYRGLPKSGSQISASFTSDGSHIISVGLDSRVCIWNHEYPDLSSSKNKRSSRACEYFNSDGVSVAVPWSGTTTGQKVSNIWSTEHAASSRIRDPPGFSLTNLFSSRGSATWPEDMLPVTNQPQDQGLGVSQGVIPPTWGLVIVTASCDGIIRPYHNYGLPIKV